MVFSMRVNVCQEVVNFYRGKWSTFPAESTPGNEDELVALVDAATRASSPLIPRGIGSSPYAAWAGTKGLMVSFQHMNAIVEVDQRRQLATVEPGVV